MIEFLKSIAPQEWLALASAVAAAVTSVIGFISGKNGQKLNSKQTGTLTDMTGGIIDVLTDVKKASETIVDGLKETVSTVNSSLETFKTALADNREQNLTVAAFILECFNQSNLSDEKKSKLQVMFDQMFYTDKTELINKLHEAKDIAEAKLVESEELRQSMTVQIADLESKLATATSASKKSRRI